MTNTKTLVSSALVALAAIATTAAVAQSAPAAKPDFTFEKCYGVAKTGLNDCQTASHSCAGTSTVDFDPVAWKLIKKGTCTATEVKLPDGTARKGALEAISG